MPSTSYLLEKVTVALSCLASGSDSFESRLQNAYIPALMVLKSEDAPPDLVEDLEWILDLCQQHHIKGTEIMTPVSAGPSRPLFLHLMGCSSANGNGFNIIGVTLADETPRWLFFEGGPWINLELRSLLFYEP